MRDNKKRYNMERIRAEKYLSELLYGIVHTDRSGDYNLRNRLVVAALAASQSLGYEAGIRVDPVLPAWPVVFIELPTGQVSWHIEQHKKEWDQHTNEEKNARIQEYAKRASAAS